VTTRCLPAITCLSAILAADALGQVPPPPPKAAPAAAAPEPPGVVARFGASYFRHDGIVLQITFSGDGKRMAVVSQNNRITIWDPASAKEIRSFTPQNGLPSRLTFSKDDKELFGLQLNASIRTWNAETGAEITPLHAQGRSYSPKSIDWSPAEKLILASDQSGTLRLINAADQSEIRTWKAHAFQAMALALAPDGKLAASMGAEGRPILWDVKEGKESKPLEPTPLSRNLTSTVAFAFSTDGKYLAQSSYDRRVYLWDTATGKIARTLEVPLNVNGAFSVVFSPDGKLLAGRMTDRTIRVWGLASGLELRCFEASGNAYEPLAFSPDSQWLAAGHGALVRIWNIRTARERFPSEGHNGAITGLLFLDHGKILASIGSDGTLRAWNLNNKKEIARTGVQSVFLNPIAPGQQPRTLTVFGYSASMELRVAERRLVTEETRQFASSGAARAVSPDGRWLICAPNQALALIDARTGTFVRNLATLRGYVQLVQFSADGRFLAAWVQQAGNEPQALRIWETATGRELPQRLPESIRTVSLRNLAFSRDGRLLALFDYNNAIHVIEAATGAMRVTFAAPAESPLATLAFNHDGTVLFLGLSNGRLMARDLVFGSQTGPFRGHANLLQSMTLSDDGKQLATGGADGAILVCSTAAVQPVRPASTAAKPDDLERWWNDLGSMDGTRVALAMWSLRQAPEKAIALIRERFQPEAPPPKPPSAEQMDRWIADLDDERFAVREKAHRALANAGKEALNPIQHALGKNPSDEVRRRLTALVRGLSGPLPSEKLRPYRVLELLERIGSPQARQLLQEMGKKAADPEFRAEVNRIAEKLPSFN